MKTQCCNFSFVVISYLIHLVVSKDTMCCETTSYASNWKTCQNAASPTFSANSCNTCAAYQCIDWTIGSKANQQRELLFFAETGEEVHFGVGSYGTDATIAGLCYRISSTSFDKDLIVQVTTSGPSDGNFHVQIADGGFGVSDACTVSGNITSGSSLPMFGGTDMSWGASDAAKLFGGWATATGCSNLPEYPTCSPDTAQDSLRELCTSSFTYGLRVPAAQSKPAISSICNVKCPTQLWQATGLQRSDEKPIGFTCPASTASTSKYLSRMMDCARPSYSTAANINGPTTTNYAQVIPCRRDGYTRVNAMPNSKSPTSAPSSASPSSSAPTFPTASPTATSPPVTSSTEPSWAPSTEPSTGPTTRPHGSKRPTSNPVSAKPTNTHAPVVASDATANDSTFGMPISFTALIAGGAGIILVISCCAWVLCIKPHFDRQSDDNYKVNNRMDVEIATGLKTVEFENVYTAKHNSRPRNSDYQLGAVRTPPESPNASEKGSPLRASPFLSGWKRSSPTYANKSLPPAPSPTLMQSGSSNRLAIKLDDSALI